MYACIEVFGIISNVMNIGEYDRRITIITKEKGKISAFARGARKANSSFIASTRLFAFGKFTLYEGKEAYNLQQANISNYFEDISADIENTCYASYFLELANYYSKEFLVEPNILKLVYYSFLAIKNLNIPNTLVRRIFELKMMVLSGEYQSDIKASPTCKYTWSYIINSPIEKLFNFKLKEEILIELASYIDIEMKKYIDYPLKSLEVLNIITKT